MYAACFSIQLNAVKRLRDEDREIKRGVKIYDIAHFVVEVKVNVKKDRNMCAESDSRNQKA